MENPDRRIRYSRAFTASGIGLATVLIAVLLASTVGPFGQRSQALAEVVASINSSRIVHWVESSNYYDSKARIIDTTATDYWARLDPPVISWHMLKDTASANRNHAMNEILRKMKSHTVLDSSGDPSHYEENNDVQIIYDPRTNVYKTTHSLPDAKNGDMIRHDVLIAIVGPYLTSNLNSHDPKLLGYTTGMIPFKGAMVNYFSREAPVKSPNDRERTRSAEKIWADPVTHHLLRRESVQYYPGSDRVYCRTVADQYTYNQIPPQGTFDLKPPPGAKIVIVRPSLGQSKPDDDKGKR